MYFRTCQNRPPATGKKHIRHYSLRQPGSNTSALWCSEQQCCKSYTLTHKSVKPAGSAKCNVFPKHNIVDDEIKLSEPCKNGGLHHVLKTLYPLHTSVNCNFKITYVMSLKRGSRSTCHMVTWTQCCQFSDKQ